MTQWKRARLASSTALVSVLLTGVAIADVTPEEVWQNWQDISTTSGQIITTTSVARDGDALVVTDFVSSFEQEDVAVNIAIDEVVFTDNGDGTVTMTMSEEYPIEMTFPAAAGDDGPTDITVLVAQPGLEVLAAGDALAASYEFKAPSLTIMLNEISGVDAERLDVEATAILTDMAGSYLVSGEVGAKSIESAFSAANMTLAMSGADAETASSFVLAASIADLAGASKSLLKGVELIENLAAALKAGFATDSTFSYGAVNLDLDTTENSAPTRIVTNGKGGGFNVKLDATGMTYGANGNGAEITITSPAIPFSEVKLSYAEGAFNLMMPMLKSEAPEDFTFVTRIVDLAVSDEIWGMIDPGGAIPHDPATVILDTKGKVKLTSDLADPAQMEALGENAPGEIHALDLTELKVTAAGADLTGIGSLTFDNSDMVTFAGSPLPTGKIDLKLVGGNALIDKLVTMGILTSDDANGARMMMSMFANPGAGADELTSTLEFKDKGFFANGQQLQ